MQTRKGFMLKVVTIALIAVMSFAACGTKDKTPEPTPTLTPTEAPATPTAAPTEAPTEAPTDLPAENPDVTPVEGDGEVAGGEGETEDPYAPSEEMVAVLDSLLEGTDIEFMTGSMKADDEIFSMYFFTDPIEGADNIVSDAMVNIEPHSVALIKLPEGSDAAAVAADIEANHDPRKWICVEAEKSAVVHSDEYVLLVMSYADIVDKIVSNFNALMVEGQ